jgi:hypothetical protein
MLFAWMSFDRNLFSDPYTLSVRWLRHSSALRLPTAPDLAALALMYLLYVLGSADRIARAKIVN